MSDVDGFRSSARSVANRAAKAKTLARFLWARHLGAEEVGSYDRAELRALARAAGVNPPSTLETWNAALELVAAKEAWLAAHPGHPAGERLHLDDAWRWEPGFKAGSPRPEDGRRNVADGGGGRPDGP